MTGSWTGNQEGRVDDAYLAEVERMTARRTRGYEKQLRDAQKALAKAERATEHQRVVAENAKKRSDQMAARRREAKLWELVEERRRELKAIEAIMTELPASRIHRGSGQVAHRS